MRRNLRIALYQMMQWSRDSYASEHSVEEWVEYVGIRRNYEREYLSYRRTAGRPRGLMNKLVREIFNALLNQSEKGKK